MRLDRFITLNVIRPLQLNVQGQRSLRGQALPILMYHSISNGTERGVPAYYRTTTSPTIFAKQMEWLHSNGYRVVTLSEWLRSLNRSATAASASETLISQPSMRVVSVTFDDGFHDFFTAAWPALKQYGFTASVFLPTAFIADSGRRSFKGRDCMTWNEVIKLHDAGIEFGSHTFSHPKLVDLDWLAIENQLRTSKDKIESRIGSAVDAFAYPYAYPETDRGFVGRFSSLLEKVGYNCCATTRIGRARVGDDMLQLKRLPVNSCDDTVLFQAKIEGAYDWLAKPQVWLKKLKRGIAPAPSSGSIRQGRDEVEFLTRNP